MDFDTAYTPATVTAALELLDELRDTLERIGAIAEAGKQWLGPADDTDTVARNLFECIARETHGATAGHSLRRFLEQTLLADVASTG